MGLCTSKQTPNETSKTKQDKQRQQRNGVFLACHQKFKRRGKEGKKNEIKAQTDSPVLSGHKESKQVNGVRKRGKKNDYLAKTSDEMGILQSKTTGDVEVSKTSPQYEPIQLNANVQKEPPNGCVELRTDHKKDGKGIITRNSRKDEEGKLEMDMTTNHSENSFTTTSQGDINKIVNYPMIERNAEANDVVTLNSSLQVSKLVVKKCDSNHYTSTETPDRNIETSKEICFENSVEDLNNKMPYFVDDTKVNTQLKSLPQKTYTEEVSYVTIEEKVVCEEYDDGTQVTRTVTTEIPHVSSDESPKYHGKSIDELAHQLSSSVLQSACENSVQSRGTNLVAEKPLVCEFVDTETQKKLSKFKIFVFNKYAEKLINKMIKASVHDALPVLKEKTMSTKYANSLADSIVNNVLEHNFPKQKTNNVGSNKVFQTVDSTTVPKTKYKQLNLFANELVEISLNNDTLTQDILKLSKAERAGDNNKVEDISHCISENIIDMTFKDLEKNDLLLESSIKIDTDFVKLTPNGFHPNEEDLNPTNENKNHAPVVVLHNAINKELTLTVSNGDLKVTGTDQNQNNLNDNIDGSSCKVLLRRKTGPATDRPLSGFAEKLAELLEEEDDLDFLDSDEELQESLEKIKTNFGPKRRISIEVSNYQRRLSDKDVSDLNTTNLKSKVAVKRRNQQNKFKGDRPMSLYAQDMLADILNDDEDSEEEFSGDEAEDDDVLEDEILPVKETAVLLENVIPLAPVTRNFSISEFEVQLDEVMKGERKHSMAVLGTGKSPALQRAVVIDTGCGAIKAGFCGDVKPQCYCPSVIGVPRRFSQDVSKMKKGYYVGDEAWTMAGMLQIEHPMKQNISNWPDVTNMMEYVMDQELKADDNEHPVLMTEMGLTSRKHREKLSEIMFERFGVPAFYLGNQSSLAMYSMGMMSGICLNSGFYNTQATAIYEGHSIPHATIQLDIGGDHVTNQLGRVLLDNQGLSFRSSSEKLVLNSMKQNLCYVAQDVQAELNSYKTNLDKFQMYTLPDGQEIEVGSERCLATEILFDPQLIGLHQPNTAELIEQSIAKMDIELHPLLSENVLVTGGNSKLPGYGSRLESELLMLLRDADNDICINYAEDPLLSAWIGGSILSSISIFRDQWITLDQYAEHGAKVVHTVCF